MIEVSSLCKNYGAFHALTDLNFSVDRKHGITALLGPNGAGKTSTLRLITGFLQPTSGKISYSSLSMKPANYLKIKKKIGYLPETTPLYQEMLVIEYLEFISRVRGVAEKDISSRIDEMIEMLSLSSHLYTPLFLLSKGFRQRVALAGTLIHLPEYIILDEPTSGLDPNQIQQIRKLIKSLGKKHTLILSTHILQEVEDICDRVIILSRGRVVANEDTSVLRNVKAIRLLAKGDSIQKNIEGLEYVQECSLASYQEEGSEYKSYICKLKEDQPEALFAHIAKQNWSVREFSPLARSLQEVFHELTS